MHRYESESGGNRSLLALAESSGEGVVCGSTENRSRERGDLRHRECCLPLRANLAQLEFQLILAGIPKATVNALLDRAKKTLLFERRPLAILLGGETVRSCASTM